MVMDEAVSGRWHGIGQRKREPTNGGVVGKSVDADHRHVQCCVSAEHNGKDLQETQPPEGPMKSQDSTKRTCPTPGSCRKVQDAPREEAKAPRSTPNPKRPQGSPRWFPIRFPRGFPPRSHLVPLRCPSWFPLGSPLVPPWFPPGFPPGHPLRSPVVPSSFYSGFPWFPPGPPHGLPTCFPRFIRH